MKPHHAPPSASRRPPRRDDRVRPSRETSTGNDENKDPAVRLQADQETESPRRVARVVELIVAFCSAESDAHSIELLCRVADVGVGPWTLRRWCAAESIRPARLVDLARLLSAVILATKRGAAPLQWLELDPRTYRALLGRAGVRDLFIGTNLPTPVGLIRRQHLVTNPAFIDALAAALGRPERD